MNRMLLKREDVYRGNLILVNKKYGCGEFGKEDLIPVREERYGVLLRQRAVVLLASLMEEIRGWNGIVPVSGFRSIQEQQKIWDGSLLENGKEFTEKFVALPGHSEHQTGLAIDLGVKMKKIDFICPAFPYSGICQTFRERAADYGFVERYPKGKEDITGIGHEPWHFRYVGVPHAAVMAQKELTLEEYVDFLKGYAFGENPFVYEQKGRWVEISYLPLPDESREILLDDRRPYSISGNNMDGCIITQWESKTASGRRNSA